VAKIVQTDRVKILANVPEKDVGFCKRGQDVGIFPGEVRFDQMTQGKIYYVGMTGDPVARTYRTYVEMDNRSGKLRPGMIVRVGLIRQQIEKALAAPLYAIVDRGDRKAVFVEKDGRAVLRYVTPGIMEQDKVQVTSGLSEGDHLIVVGHRDLVDGVEVKVEGTAQP
jgi:membrane fusion protein (multidrug efflux system)